MDYIREYRNALEAMHRWTKKKEDRERALRRYYDQRHPEKDTITVTYLIERDQEVREAQAMMDQCALRASALGPAANLQAQGQM